MKWLALAAFAAFTFTAQAQVSLGLRGGYQMSNINVTDGLDALAPDFKTIDAANRGQPDRKSNASQIDRSAGDLFYKYASRGREIAREWGSYSRK